MPYWVVGMDELGRVRAVCEHRRGHAERKKADGCQRWCVRNEPLLGPYWNWEIVEAEKRPEEVETTPESEAARELEVRTHTWPSKSGGWVTTVTLYQPDSFEEIAKLNGPLAPTREEAEKGARRLVELAETNPVEFIRRAWGEE